jgi:hypothetical protein
MRRVLLLLLGENERPRVSHMGKGIATELDQLVVVQFESVPSAARSMPQIE